MFAKKGRVNVTGLGFVAGNNLEFSVLIMVLYYTLED